LNLQASMSDLPFHGLLPSRGVSATVLYFPSWFPKTIFLFLFLPASSALEQQNVCPHSIQSSGDVESFFFPPFQPTVRIQAELILFSLGFISGNLSWRDPSFTRLGAFFGDGDRRSSLFFPVLKSHDFPPLSTKPPSYSTADSARPPCANCQPARVIICPSAGTTTFFFF